MKNEPQLPEEKSLSITPVYSESHGLAVSTVNLSRIFSSHSSPASPYLCDYNWLLDLHSSMTPVPITLESEPPHSHLVLSVQMVHSWCTLDDRLINRNGLYSTDPLYWRTFFYSFMFIMLMKSWLPKLMGRGTLLPKSLSRKAFQSRSPSHPDICPQGPSRSPWDNGNNNILPSADQPLPGKESTEARDWVDETGIGQRWNCPLRQRQKALTSCAVTIDYKRWGESSV